MGDVSTLQNVRGTAPNDGRTEQVVNTTLDGYNTKNEYTEAQKPNAGTLVFRSYSSSADGNELTKLKVVFNNKVKTGKLIIRKVPAKGETLEGKEFAFTVRFGDVGGQSLGDTIEQQTYTCTVKQHGDKYYGEIVIDKIPVGTRFVVSEKRTAGHKPEIGVYRWRQRLRCCRGRRKGVRRHCGGRSERCNGNV